LEPGDTELWEMVQEVRMVTVGTFVGPFYGLTRPPGRYHLQWGTQDLYQKPLGFPTANPGAQFTTAVKGPDSPKFSYFSMRGSFKDPRGIWGCFSLIGSFQ